MPGEPFVDAMQIYLELSRRAGRLPHLYEAFNNIAKLREPHKLDPDGHYSYFEICDRWLKNTLGEDKGLDWHLRDGLWTADKTVQQKYPRPFFDARAQVYCEFMVQTKEDLERTVEELGIPWETDDYQPVPDWKPGPAYERTPPHDLFVTNMKVPNHALSHTHKNSILSTLSTRHNDLRSVWINPRPPRRGAFLTETWWRSRRRRDGARQPTRGSPSLYIPRFWPPRAAAAAGRRAAGATR